MAGDTVLQMVTYRVLGPVALVVDGEVRHLGGAQRKQVLGLLIAARGRSVAVEQLIDHLWPDDPPASARKTIQVNVHHLRSHLGEALVTETGGYRLDTNGSVDAVEFEELVRTGRDASDPVASATALAKALDLWRGAPYSDTADLESLEPERVRLEELRLVALETLYDARLRTGAVTELVPDLEGAVAGNPLRDRLRRQLMLALYRSGRERDALAAFHSYRAELAEVGLDPPEETIELERQIIQRDPDLDAEASGHALLSYQITERLGEGAFSVVYKGLQPSVGREVAIKQIRAELANLPEFIRRFEAEANMVAHLEHPHVVPLIDYWREPGSAYLVMRLLRGGSLETSVIGSPWPLDRTVTMATQIGSALAAAHRAGIVHRDVKSANILLDEDGHAYLSDFGIALDATELADPEVALSAGSPAYASPEQLRREPIGPGADVHGLAIAVFEALTGRLPFPDEPDQAALLRRQLNDPIPLVRNIRSDLPATVDDVLQRATAKAPTDRYQTAEEFIEALTTAIAPSNTPKVNRSAGTQVSLEERNPYKGLRAFGEADAGDFAGRDRLVAQLIDVLGFRRVVAVVGPSGSGKSSVVRAALLPALRRGAIPGSNGWYLATLVPGTHPYEELEATLTRLAADNPAGLLDVLTDGERGIGRGVRRVIPEGGQLLLVVDQFEELFTMCPDERERKRFLDGLASAVNEERSRLRVVFTLRADFYDRPLRYEAIGRLIRDAHVGVLPLAADELEHAIMDPARSVGVGFEAGLVSELVADVADEPGALPMLQYALTELYERRVANIITRDAYSEIGGLSGALAKRADELHLAASDEQQLAIRRVFGRLVTLGEGVEDTRRRALRSELATSQAATDAIDAFGDARLLSFDTDPMTREPTVEVAHEALIREWPRFREWLDDDRESLRLLRHINQSALAWQDADRSESELYRGGRLETAEAWTAENFDELTPTEREFIAAGVSLRGHEQEVEIRAHRRLQRLLVGVGIVAVIAMLAGAFAFRQGQVASDQRDRAEASSEAATAAAAEAETERARAQAFASRTEAALLSDTAAEQSQNNRRLGLLLALEAVDRDATLDATGELQRILADMPGVLGFVGPDHEYLVARWLSDTELAALREGALDVIDTATGRVTATYRVDVAPYSELGGFPVFDVNTSGALAAVAVDSGLGRRGVVTIDVARQRTSFLEHEARITAVALSQSGRLLAIGDSRREIRLVDPVSGTEVGAIPDAHPETSFRDVLALEDVGLGPVIGRSVILAREARLFNGIQALAFDDSGDTLASAAGTLVREWNVLTGQQSGTTRHLFTQIYSDSALADVVESGFPFERVGQLLYDDSQLITAGETAVALFGPSPWPDPVALEASVIPDGEFLTGVFPTTIGRLAITSSAGVVREFNLGDHALITRVEARSGRTRSVVPSPDGTRFVLAGERGLMLGSVRGDHLIATAVDVSRLDPSNSTGGDEDNFVTVTSSGRYVVASNRARGSGGTANGQPLLFDADTDELSSLRVSGTFRVSYALSHPTRDLLAFYDADNLELTVVDAESGEVIAIAPGAGAAVSVSPDMGSMVFIEAQQIVDPGGGEDFTRLRIVDLVSGSPDKFILLRGLGAVPFEGFASWAPDGERLAIRIGHRHVAFYDTATWMPIDGVELTDATAFRFTDDGGMITVTSDGSVALLSPTLEVVRRISLPPVDDVDFRAPQLSSDGRFLLRPSDAYLYDFETGDAIGTEFIDTNSTTRPSGTSSAERLVLATLFEGTLNVWNVDPTTWRDAVCSAVGRNMTRAEWDEYGPESEYVPTCRQWPLEPDS